MYLSKTNHVAVLILVLASVIMTSFSDQIGVGDLLKILSDNPRGNDEDKKPVKQKVFVDNPVNEKVAKHPTTHTPSSTGSEPKKRNEPAAEELTRIALGN
uniref:Uncharacterized protein n=1 Tax=Arion vulgaris TaxID=1028688 RepID=A0A0B7B872_9EUPU